MSNTRLDLPPALAQGLRSSAVAEGRWLPCAYLHTWLAEGNLGCVGNGHEAPAPWPSDHTQLHFLPRVQTVPPDEEEQGETR